MTVAIPEARPACDTRHPKPVPAETWSWVFGGWLCGPCLHRRSSAESQRTPGAYLDPRPVIR